MKKQAILPLLRLLAPSLLTGLLGLVLLLSPDTATALFSRLLGWVFLLVAISDFLSARAGSKQPILRTIVLALIGLWTLMNPLSIAKSLGRILGLTFFIWGSGHIRRNRQDKLTPGIVAAGVIALVGIVLFLVPMTVTRLVLNIAGIVIIGISISDGYDRLRGRKRIDGGTNPDIIDVEKV